jgi:hypothetical protein
LVYLKVTEMSQKNYRKVIEIWRSLVPGIFQTSLPGHRHKKRMAPKRLEKSQPCLLFFMNVVIVLKFYKIGACLLRILL